MGCSCIDKCRVSPTHAGYEGLSSALWDVGPLFLGGGNYLFLAIVGKCSIGDKSKEYAVHDNWLTLWSFKMSVVALAECGRALSCWEKRISGCCSWKDMAVGSRISEMYRAGVRLPSITISAWCLRVDGDAFPHHVARSVPPILLQDTPIPEAFSPPSSDTPPPVWPIETDAAFIGKQDTPPPQQRPSLVEFRPQEATIPPFIVQDWSSVQDSSLEIHLSETTPNCPRGYPSVMVPRVVETAVRNSFWARDRRIRRSWRYVDTLGRPGRGQSAVDPVRCTLWRSLMMMDKWHPTWRLIAKGGFWIAFLD
ncbi:hypothetical protein CAPTEDRAFT_202588 [Capitella teleta]|uniref:Uncharacterized protein n=1 Tax=Capitella teleta TaxID=283909 RepID=R7V3V8_CAPTE|nr:hypothetical protein CAPTEDRAFT_202588 [Capitella teleta]|eukprot:ELU13147.1 hypothetical protein CAPTEDRAFT_202588 [Capitella teleta]